MNTGLDELRRMRLDRGEVLTFEDLAIVTQIRPSGAGIGNVAEDAARDIVDACLRGTTLAACIRARSAVGVEKYGTVLQVRNGRSHLVDAFQELLDAAQYLTGEIIEAQTEDRGRTAAVAANVRHHVYEAIELLTYMLMCALEDVNHEAINEG